MHDTVILLLFGNDPDRSPVAGHGGSVLPSLPPGTVFKEDVLSPYYYHMVWNCLNYTMPSARLSRGAPNAWPSRSPDLTALDFFPVGLCDTRDALATETHNMLQDTWT
jgi:hypothetical protein